MDVFCSVCNRKCLNSPTTIWEIIFKTLSIKNIKPFFCLWCENVLVKFQKLLMILNNEDNDVKKYEETTKNIFNLSITKLQNVEIKPTIAVNIYDNQENIENECIENDEIYTFYSSSKVEGDSSISKKIHTTGSGFEVIYLSMEEQRQDIEIKKKSEKYMKMSYKCEWCGIGYVSIEAFEEHKLRHDYSSGDHTCPLCNLHFKSYLVLSQHKLCHKRRFKCMLCNKMFKRWAHALGHRPKCGTAKNYVKCDVCLKIFSDVISLNIHKNIHTRIKKYICNECGKSFGTKQHLVTHLRTHSGTKPFGCTICDKTFATNSNLKAHRTVHEKTKPFFCVECNKSYKSEKNLNRHISSSVKHSSGESHQCQDCPKIFSTMTSLNLHRKSHFNTYKCDFCNKIFSNNSNLKKHLRCVHENG